MDKILLAHGGGGRLTKKLIEDIFVSELGNEALSKLEDSAIFEHEGGKLAFTTDSYVVNPIFFPGGDIGKLAVYGTVNDLSVAGARPLYISLGLIIEEGFPIDELKKIVKSIKEAASFAKVKIICGDTKVVEKGSADKIFINTSGIGKVISHEISSAKVMPGDKVILSGSIGDHGIAVLQARAQINFKSNIESDCAPLNSLVEKMLSSKNSVHAMRDPTRGGLATLLNEIAKCSNVDILINEENIPIKEEVRGACELLGLDPLYLANEGKLVAFVDGKTAEGILSIMKKDPRGADASIIGEAKEGKGAVIMKTKIGGERIVDTFSGEQLPRIC
ncbi:MAG: hydrogenase expression/formation protein HypE [Candidatus Saganbacteria bacterium]|nr:hydrogenase expression/formation protein HypE [Candidatus Saganbacteria bacterium]